MKKKKKMFGKGAPRCPRCAQSVYQAEEVIGAGQKWHNHCFTCKECNTRLSSTTLTERSGEIYCAPCYAKAFGPKGFGIGGTTVQTGVSVVDYDAKSSGSSSSSSASSSAGGKIRCASCGANGQSGKFCGECGKTLSAPSSSPSTSSSSSGSSVSYSSNQTFSNTGSRAEPAKLFGSSASNAGKAQFGSGDKCGKCGTSVYAAEKVTAAGRSFHESCFKCNGCNTRLNSLELNDKDGVLFCGACYAKNFGPKGFGIGGTTVHTGISVATKK